MATNKSLITLDTSELEAAVRQLSAHLGKDLPKALNKKMAWLLRRWFWKLPQVPATRINSQLGLRMRQTGSGKWRRVGARTFKRADQDVPLIVAIIQKRGSPFKGVSRKEGLRRMKAAVKKISGARARSSGYLKSGVVSAMQPFLRFASGGRQASPPRAGMKPTGRAKGFGFPAREGGTSHTAIASDQTISRNRWSRNKKPEDAALRKYALPALREAYREELADTLEFLNKTLYDTARKVGISARR